MIKKFESFIEDLEKLEVNNLTNEIWGTTPDEVEDIFLYIDDSISDIFIHIKFGVAKSGYEKMIDIPFSSSAFELFLKKDQWRLEVIKEKYNNGEVIPIIRVYFRLTKEFSDRILGDLDYSIESDDSNFTEEFKLWKDSIYKLQSQIQEKIEKDIPINILQSKGYTYKTSKVDYFSNTYDTIEKNKEVGDTIFLVELLRIK
jgi:hypothetical protein